MKRLLLRVLCWFGSHEWSWEDYVIIGYPEPGTRCCIRGACKRCGRT